MSINLLNYRIQIIFLILIIYISKYVLVINTNKSLISEFYNTYQNNYTNKFDYL